MIIWKAPARIDLAGGTLDIPPLCYMMKDVVTLNLAIDLTTSVSCELLERGTPAEVVYGEGAPVPAKSEPLFHELLTYFGREHGVRFRVWSSVPRASGLGGSSVLLTALVRAMLELDEEEVDEPHLLEIITVLEHRLLQKPAGTQDAIAAIYGGLSHISYNRGRPTRISLPLPGFLSERLFLAYSSRRHHSGIENWRVLRAACEGEIHSRRVLMELRDNALAMAESLQHEDEKSFARCARREASLRQVLCEEITPPDLAAFAKELPEQVVGKMCGAGGGGCMVLFGEGLQRASLQEQARPHGLEIIETRASERGLREVSA